MTYQVERWREFYADAKSLMQRHWEEIALDKEHIALSLDEPKYQSMCDSGILHILSVRNSDAELVGYYIAFVIPHIHYMNAGLMAFTDIYWLAPEARKGNLGVQMFVEVEKSLIAKNVVKAYLSHKAHKDNSALFTRLGWKLSDLSYCKMLGSH